MNRRRVEFVVSVDLDPLPGAAHTEGDWLRWLQRQLDATCGHYSPRVEWRGVEVPDSAIPRG